MGQKGALSLPLGNMMQETSFGGGWRTWLSTQTQDLGLVDFTIKKSPWGCEYTFTRAFLKAPGVIYSSEQKLFSAPLFTSSNLQTFDTAARQLTI